MAKRKVGGGTGKASKGHGKDAKIAKLVREAEKQVSGKEKEANFEAKKIGKKAIFRPILTSPFNARWPALTPVQEEVILYSLLHLIQSQEAQTYFKRDSEAAPRGSSRDTKDKKKRRKARLALHVLKEQGVISSLATEIAIRRPASTLTEEETTPSERPFLCGLNSVTRQMESLVRQQLGTSEASTSSSVKVQHQPSVVFVCQADVDPPSLVSHFPLLCSTYNAVLGQESYLIRLPLDAEKQICEATSLRRCSVISIDETRLEKGSSLHSTFQELIAKIKDAGVQKMQMGWLDQAIASLQGKETPPLHLVEPQIKHMRTSAPVKINAVKAFNRAQRAARKAERREKGLTKFGKRPDHQHQIKKGKKWS